MTRDDSFADRMLRLRQGDEAAAAGVFDRFAHRLIGLARLRLEPMATEDANLTGPTES
jgi:hypothetical protein